MDPRAERPRSGNALRRLVLPNLMVDLLATGRWKHPGDEPIREVMPWFEDPLIFLANADQMRHESQSLDLFADDKRLSELFRVRRGTAASPVDLPWLDAELAILVAVNMNPGDDVAIALDYRSDPVDPRVLASDFWTDPKQCTWRFVAPALAAFVAALGLLADSSAMAGRDSG
jgi:hypothetical protein